MKSNKKNISSTNKTLARLLSLVYFVLAVAILNGALVLNSSITERPFWLSATDSMGTLTLLVFFTVLFLNVLTKAIFFPLLSFQKVRALDERQRAVRNSSLVFSFIVTMFVLPVFMYLLKKQIEADLSFIQSQGELVVPILGIDFLLIGLPSAIAVWRRGI